MSPSGQFLKPLPSERSQFHLLDNADDFGRSLPQVQFKAELMDNPIFSHVLAGRDSQPARLAERSGFEVVHSDGDFVVLRRNRR